MREVLVIIANLFLPGSAQVARDELAWGVTFALGFSGALAAGLLSLAFAPGLLSRAGVTLLFAAALAFWLASQLLYLRAVRSRDGAGGHRAEVLGERFAAVARLWLRGERGEALLLLEPLLRRWPREPALHFVAAQLWGEGADEESRARAREFLQLCRACDLEGGWRRAAEREFSRLAEPGREAGG